MKKKKIITYVIGIIAFALPVIVYFTPPTDSDRGNLISDSDNYEVYYKVNNDSLFLYSRGVDFSFFNKERIPLPILTKKHNIHTDSISELKNKGFRKFEWK